MLRYTGERMIVEQVDPLNGMLLEHLARYYFALYYTKGRVLDFACGTGYGSKLVAKAQKKSIDELVAIDIDKDTIEYAKQKSYHPLIQYCLGDVTDRNLPGKLGQFDTIISFETIEHVEDEEAFLANIYELLKPGGTLILSTPFGAGRGKPTNEPFHVHQLTETQFHSLFTSYSQTEFFYQRSVLIEPKRLNKHYPFGIAVCVK